jgi:hypothetical protein
MKMERETPTVATIETPCRKCEPCLLTRSQLWAARARDEIAIAPRTWFGTLTLAPAQALQAKFAAEIELTKRGHCLDEVSKADHFRAVAAVVSPEITRTLKRIRKNSEARIRYLLVCEAHEGGGPHDGVPHWHILLHEHHGKVTKRKLEASWRYGFSHFRLVDKQATKTAWYVCKYLSKSALARVRASQSYGAPKVATITELVEQQLAILGSHQMQQNQKSHDPLYNKGPLGYDAIDTHSNCHIL